MISLIWAMDKNRLIGKGNNLPWYYKTDLKYFKEKTINKTCVMGVNTFLSIIERNKKALPNRKLVVCSLDNFSYPDVLVINDLEKFLKDNEDTMEEVFVIGGKTIYNLSLPYARKLYITYINEEHEGDLYFDEFDLSKFELISSNVVDNLDFSIYERKNKE